MWRVCWRRMMSIQRNDNFRDYRINNKNPFVLLAAPENHIDSNCLMEEFLKCIDCLQSAGYNVRACVSDNHPSNVAAYLKLLLKYAMNSNYDLRICINGKPYTFSMTLSTSSKTSETICWTEKDWYFIHFHATFRKIFQLKLMLVKSHGHYTA